MAKGKQFARYIYLQKNNLKTIYNIIIFSNIIMPRKYAKKYAKPRARKYAKKSKAKTSLVRLIRKVIHKTSETKLSSQEMVVGFGNSLQSTVLNVRTLSPSSAYMPIQQGPSQDERIGNKIQTKKVMLRYVLHSLPYNAATNTANCPQDVVMWIGRLKRSIFSPTSTDFSNFFQYGSASVPPLGDLSDLNAVINKDYFTIDKKIIHKIGYADYSGTSVNVAAHSYTNNDYKFNVVRSLDITNCFAKNYTFNDVDNDPQNSRTYIWFEAIRADGLTGLGTNIPIMFRATLDYTYTDV